MVRVTYDGPSQHFKTSEGGKTYQRGDTFDLAKEVVAHLTRYGHRFLDNKGELMGREALGEALVEARANAAQSVSQTPAPPAETPKDAASKK